MPSKEQEHYSKANKEQSLNPATGDFEPLAEQQTNSAAALQKVKLDPKTRTPHDVLQLQRTIGNRAVSDLFSEAKPRLVIQAKLTEEPALDGVQQGKTEGGEYVPNGGARAIQRKGLEKGVLNVAGETHNESEGRRNEEKLFSQEITKEEGYWKED